MAPLSYFASDRNLPWWAIAISNTATYQSGSGAFVMLLFMYGLAANWLWWASWIIWMPLVAIIWAPLWRRMRIMTTAELISLRYGGRPASCRPKDVRRCLLFRLFRVVDRVHHWLLRQNHCSDRQHVGTADSR